VVKATAGDQDAWEILYLRVYPRLLAYTPRRLETEQTHDAVAETMVRAVGGTHRFDSTAGRRYGWLFGILRHVALDAYRLRAKQERQPHTREQAPDQGPLEQVLADQDAIEMRAAFAQLEPADGELLELRVVAGLSSDDVASILGKRAGTVRMTQARPLKRLRQNLRAQP
jgi:RNA polymerase sigma-70 factor (ECF subfamily)